MFKRILFFAYGSVCYLIFLGTFLYAVCFIGNFGIQRTLDGAVSGPLGISFSIDAALLTLFAVQHSVMARKWFKDQWTRIVPKPIERSTYVLFSSLALILLFWQLLETPAVADRLHTKIFLSGLTDLEQPESVARSLLLYLTCAKARTILR